MKQLQKDIGQKDKIEIRPSLNVDSTDLTNNRLSVFKEYIKRMVRSQTPISFSPTDIKPAGYPFIRLYNSYEYKYAKRMFNLNQIAMENKFENTAYIKDRGFVFVEDPSFLSLHKAYYYDAEDFSNGTKIEENPNLVIKPKLSMLGTELKEPVAKPAYAIPVKGPSTLEMVKTGIKTGAAGAVDLASKVPLTDLSKGLLLAGKETVEDMGYAAKSVKTSMFGEGKAKIKQEQEEASQIGGARRGGARSKLAYAAIRSGITKTGAVLSSGAKLTGDTLKYAYDTSPDTAVYLLQKQANFLGGVFSLVVVPLELLTRLALVPVILTGLSMKSVAVYFSDNLDKNSYLSLNNIAIQKASECEKIAKLLRTNWAHTEHTRTQQNVLQVLSNLYANVEYIEQQEIAFRDLHEYPIETFKKMVGNLVTSVSDPLFEKGKLYPLLKDTKKMTYVVYRMLQECVPIKLSDKRSEILGVKKGPTSELEIKLEELEKQLKEEEAKVAKAMVDKDSTDTKVKDKAVEVIAESTAKITQLKAEIVQLKTKKSDFDGVTCVDV
jgi:hypothetical protein